MARRKRRQRRPAATAVERIGLHEAAVLLEKLREMGRVTASHLQDARRAVVREIEEITARLSQLRETAHVPASSRKAPKSVPAAKTQPAWPAAERPRKRTKAPVSAERRKTMQLQGRYLGLMHKVPKAELAKFRAMIPRSAKKWSCGGWKSTCGSTERLWQGVCRLSVRQRAMLQRRRRSERTAEHSQRPFASTHPRIADPAPFPILPVAEDRGNRSRR